MKVYKFIFLVGFLNLTVPFLGIPSVYKEYILISLAIITLAYGLILRAVEKEREFNKKQRQQSQQHMSQEKTIEEVVDMNEKIFTPDIVPKRRGRKPKVIEEKVYE
jgi:hypothetical protein